MVEIVDGKAAVVDGNGAGSATSVDIVRVVADRTVKAAIDDQNASMMNQDHHRNRESADQTMRVIVGAKAAAAVDDRITTKMATVATVHRHQARDTVDHRRTGIKTSVDVIMSSVTRAAVRAPPNTHQHLRHKRRRHHRNRHHHRRDRHHRHRPRLTRAGPKVAVNETMGTICPFTIDHRRLHQPNRHHHRPVFLCLIPHRCNSRSQCQKSQSNSQ